MYLRCFLSQDTIIYTITEVINPLHGLAIFTAFYSITKRNLGKDIVGNPLHIEVHVLEYLLCVSDYVAQSNADRFQCKQVHMLQLNQINDVYYI